MKNRLIAFCLISISLVLASCGGGGGGSGGSTNPATSSAEGIWTGKSSSGYDVALIVLNDGSTWGLYSSVNTIWGALNGTTTSSGNSFSGTGSDFNFATRTSASGTYSGSVVAGSTINATTSSGTTFNGVFNSAYNTPGNLSLIAGTYTGWGITKATLAETLTVTISSGGIISAAATNCTISGTVTPHPSGKNVYNVSTTFSGSNCALVNGTTTAGIAVIDETSGIKKLYALSLNNGKTDGYMFKGNLSGSAGSATSVPVTLAYQNYSKAASNQIFNLVTSNGCLGTFSSVKSDATATAVFESINSHYSTTTSILSYSNCTPATSNGVTQEYYDVNYLPQGNIVLTGSPLNNGYYAVYATTPVIPATVNVGDTGTIGTLNVYTDSTKTTPAGSRVVTYAVGAETLTSVLLNVSTSIFDVSNNLSMTEVDTVRVTTAGVASILSITLTYANGVVVNFR